MKLVAIMPVRNEAWVLGLSARAALMWCDELLMLVHASDMATERIATELTCEFPGRAWVSFDPDPEWREMEHRQNLLEGARDHGATHIAIVDADELLTGNLLCPDSPTCIDGATTHYSAIRNLIHRLSPGHVLRVPGYNLRGSIDRYHANGIWGNRLFSLAFKDDPRANWQGDQFHHREPFGVRNIPFVPLVGHQGGVMHLWGASERRLVAKHALYKMTERLRWPDKPAAAIDRLYNFAVHESASDGSQYACRWDYAGAPDAWWAPYSGLMQYLQVDAEPWQEHEAQRLLEHYGPERFDGLDLFGLAA